MKYYAIAGAVALIMALPVAAQAEPAEPAARIAAYNESVVEIMKQRLGFPARRDRFEALVREYYDMPVVAQMVVGVKWTASTPADRDAAIAALTRHSAVTLARNFGAYGGERFTVDPAVASRGASKVIRVRIESPGHGDTLLYVLRSGNMGWKIVDVVSEGVSQLAVQRSDLAASVAADGAAGMARRLAKLDAAVR